MSQRKISTRDVYTPGRPAAKRRPGPRPVDPAAPGRAGRGARPLPGAAARFPSRLAAVALGLSLAAPAAAEELIRVRVSTEPERIEEVRLEDYVAGVLAGEMPASFPTEALRAQAVAARSYALTRKIEAQAANRPWDIAAGVLAQMYVPGAAGAAARAAAEATAGEVLVVGMEPVEAYFHAVCGGETEAGLPALGRDLAYLAPVRCERCLSAPRALWTVRLEAAEVGRAAGVGGPATALRVVRRTATGRAERVEVARGAKVVALAASELRRLVGFERLPSLAFEARAEGGGFVLTGRGRGHGAGLCQWGAARLAREGKDHRAILAFYYPGTTLVRMY